MGSTQTGEHAMDFWATFLGAAFGVVAGAIIQYIVQIWIARRNRKLVLSDLNKEAQYNLGVANEMLNEVSRFRAAAQPDTFSTYQWYFRSKDMLGTVLNNIITSGQLYRIFTQREITEIQLLRQFFDPQLESTFIASKINQFKGAKDIAGAHRSANTYLEVEIKKGIATLTNLANKKL
jgi:hypothetical protein